VVRKAHNLHNRNDIPTSLPHSAGTQVSQIHIFTHAMCSTSILISFSQLSAGFPNVLNYSGSPDKIFIPFSLVPHTLGRSKLNDLISSPSYQLLNITNFEHLQHAVCYRARVRTYRTHDVEYNGAPRIQTLVIRIANYPDRLGPSGKFVKNFTKRACLKLPVFGSSAV